MWRIGLDKRSIIYRKKGCVPARKSVALWNQGPWPQKVRHGHEEAQEYIVGQCPSLEWSGWGPRMSAGVSL